MPVPLGRSGSVSSENQANFMGQIGSSAMPVFASTLICAFGYSFKGMPIGRS